MATGIVSIVGAGPGDPELLTVKAVNALARADAVIYDRLISDAVLALIPSGTIRIFAGKSCKQHFMTQDEINSLLVKMARMGKRVVRLKGGDPFIFGRGGEEAEYLAEHHIPFEIIPGISSASGCSAYSGIPLTHRGLATGVTYVTGHRQEPSHQLNWNMLVDSNTTLVVYMGLTNITMLGVELTAHGLPENTPVAAIQEGTTAHQRVVITTVSTMAADVKRENIQPPSLLIIGKVVTLRDKLAWFTGAAEFQEAIPVISRL